MTNQEGASDPVEHSGNAERAEDFAERATVAYGSAVGTTLRNNSSAYGFSITITAAFGLLASTHGSVDAPAAILFAAGAALGFVLLQVAVSRHFRRGIGSEPGNVVVISSAIDVLSILCAVAAAAGLAHVPGMAGWPLTAVGATVVYLLVGGVDVLLARWTVHHTSATAPGS